MDPEANSEEDGMLRELLEEKRKLEAEEGELGEEKRELGEKERKLEEKERKLEEKERKLEEEKRKLEEELTKATSKADTVLRDSCLQQLGSVQGQLPGIQGQLAGIQGQLRGIQDCLAGIQKQLEKCKTGQDQCSGSYRERVQALQRKRERESLDGAEMCLPKGTSLCQLFVPLLVLLLAIISVCVIAQLHGWSKGKLAAGLIGITASVVTLFSYCWPNPLPGAMHHFLGYCGQRLRRWWHGRRKEVRKVQQRQAEQS